MIVCGIDPGINGALAWICSEANALIDIADMPIIEVKGKKKINSSGLVELLSVRKSDLVIIEEVSSMPGQGVVSVFSFGYSAGILEGVCAALQVPLRMVRPATWKRQAGVPADKGACRMMAQRYWPGANYFGRVKDDGRADAALLAKWGINHV
jgi:crossover junction endodeoxyribonuclease RuvC